MVACFGLDDEVTLIGGDSQEWTCGVRIRAPTIDRREEREVEQRLHRRGDMITEKRRANLPLKQLVCYSALDGMSS